jgi:hypothetical protein
VEKKEAGRDMRRGNMRQIYAQVSEKTIKQRVMKKKLDERKSEYKSHLMTLDCRINTLEKSIGKDLHLLEILMKRRKRILGKYEREIKKSLKKIDDEVMRWT